jgi:hypothetical protein
MDDELLEQKINIKLEKNDSDSHKLLHKICGEGTVSRT